jgi:hypothetical protein
VHVVGYIIRFYHDARSHERQIYHGARSHERQIYHDARSHERHISIRNFGIYLSDYIPLFALDFCSKMNGSNLGHDTGCIN